MSGSWSCPHEDHGRCGKVNSLPCDPGMKGCVLAGRYVFFNDDAKNERLRAKRAREAAPDQGGQGETGGAGEGDAAQTDEGSRHDD